VSDEPIRTDAIPAEAYDCYVADAFEGYENPLGLTQILCVPRGSWHERVGPFLSWALALFVEETDSPLFSKVVLIAPPGSDVEQLKMTLCASIAAHRHRLGSPAPDEDILNWLGRIVFVEIPASANSTALVATISDIPPRSAVGVLNALSFASKLDEDWGSALHALTEAMAETLEERELYLVLDTAMHGPRGARAEMLLSGGNCALFGAPKLEPKRRLEESLPGWRTIAESGNIAPVLNAIEELPIAEADHAILRILTLGAADLGQPALEEIQRLDAGAILEPETAAEIALIAAESGGSDSAVALLRRFQADFETPLALERALAAARRAVDDDLIVIFAKALQAVAPNSGVLRQHLYKEALRHHDHQRAHALLSAIPEESGRAGAHLHLANNLGAGVPDYVAIIDSASADWREFVRTQCARHALSLGLAPNALTLLLAPEAVAAGTGTYALCEALETVLLHRAPGGKLAVGQPVLAAGIDALTKRLAVDTQEKFLRVRLLNMIEPGVAGTLGGPILLEIIKQAGARVSREVSVRPDIEDPVTLGELRQDVAFWARLKAWVQAEMPLRVGRSAFPVEDLLVDADRIAEGMLHEIDFEARRIATDNADGLLMMLAFGTAVAKHARLPDLDLPMIRTAAIGLKLGGGEQRARDTVETMLEIADTPRRRRVAWFGMADVYARCDMYLEAALYAAAGLHAGGDIDDRQLWHETLVVHRLQRDMEAFDDAFQTLKRAEAVLANMGRLEAYAHQIETNRIATVMKRARVDSIDFEAFADLLRETALNARAILDANDEAEPVSMLLSQMTRQARERGIPVPADADDLLTELRIRLGSGVAEQADVLGRALPSADDLLALVRLSGTQRYSSEVGTGAKAIAMTARRTLDFDETLEELDTTCLALELKTDRAIAVPGWTDTKSPPAMIEKASAPADCMRSVSADGTSVILAGLAENGTLVRVTATEGRIGSPLREEASLFNRKRFDAWRQDYPYLYGLDTLPRGGFLSTTENLRFSELPDGPLLIVGDTRISAFPFNLMRAAPDGAKVPVRHAGEDRAVSLAPSLSWLAAARERQLPGDGRRLAWAPGGGTMKAIVDFCEGPFDKHGIVLDNQERLPDHFSGASLAIVAAHGSLNPFGGTFQVVSDEGRLAVSAGDLARSLHNVSVVLLFVCSGGRADKHPASDATMGLARDVLDQGAQAVVASPWPLNSLVPPYWLPTFLRHWDSGNTLAASVHTANRHLFERSGNDIAQGLAMMVIGNPDVTCR
jgi:CHAT domain